MGNSERDQRDGQSSGERPSVAWEHAVKSFVEGGYVVQIDRLPLGRPRFSISIGVLRDGEDSSNPANFTSRIGARYSYVDGKVNFKTMPTSGLVDRLIEMAAKWIEEEVLASEVRFQERQQRRQKQDDDRNSGKIVYKDKLGGR